MTEERFDELNLKIPQAIQFLVEANKELLEAVQELTHERNVYKAKYENEADLRRLTNEQKEF